MSNMITVYRPQGEPEVKTCLPPKFTNTYLYETMPKKTMEQLYKELAEYRTLFQEDEEWTFHLLNNAYTDVLLWKQDQLDPKYSDTYGFHDGEKIPIQNVSDYYLSKRWEGAFGGVRFLLYNANSKEWPLRETQLLYNIQELRLINYEIERRKHHKQWSYD